MKTHDPRRPRKPRRLRAPLEPGLPDPPDSEDTDPRSAMYKLRRRETIRTLCRDHYGTTGRIEQRHGSARAETAIRTRAAPEYAELHCLSNFSFQRGASSARELFERAKSLGYTALAITDECSLAGIVRALEVAEETGVKLIVGTEVRLDDDLKLVLLARNQSGYSDICRLITTGRRRSPKGEYRLTREDAESLGDGVLVLWIPTDASASSIPSPARRKPKSPSSTRQPVGDGTRRSARTDDHARWIAAHFKDRAWLAVELHRGPDDSAKLASLCTLAACHALPLVATGDVHMHVRRRRALQDVMTAIRFDCTVAEAGHALFPNAQRHLRGRDDLAAIYPKALLAETLSIAALCELDLRKLDYRYPRELVPDGLDPREHLRDLTFNGAREKWPQGIPAEVHAQLDKELALIAAKKYESFFLTVHDIVQWARRQDPPILCQGRGSSANSAVCYALGITVVAPDKSKLLFERFISNERDEPPDIDVDFEHERREEVIQYIFGKYGRGRAALAATVISYRGKSSVRDVGRALGLPQDQLDRLTGLFSRVKSGSALGEWLAERGFDPSSRVLHRLFALAGELYGFPRHLSQHVGGFVISEEPLHHLVPIENAAMPERTIIQWDKDDLEEMKLLKVDCLALGMLTCLHKCFDLLHEHGLWTLPYRGARPTLDDVPLHDDANVYSMISRADTIGVVQIESRAQQSMLPRLKPQTFYDLVIEVAIVRPGPIQGGMVHPYLKRRQGLEPVTYPSEAVRGVLERTLGVPIFQEQVMQLAIVAAGFTPGEADRLRRSMAAWKRKGGLQIFEQRLVDGMGARGYEEAFARQIYQQILGFGEYGFPESHSASFALLVYVSSWLKHYEPAAFCGALLNAQPMGFYAPAQLVGDARRHGVDVRPPDVTISEWDCALELAGSFAGAADGDAGDSPPRPALRLGLRLVGGLTEAGAARIVAARNARAFASVPDLAHRAELDPRDLAALADADALASLAGHRHEAVWDVAGIERMPALLAGTEFDEAQPALPAPTEGQDIVADYRRLGLTLRRHPLALLRRQLRERRLATAAEVQRVPHGRLVRTACIVIGRQRPDTASGVVFVTIEDETGATNVIVWRDLGDRQRRELLGSRLLGIYGKVEREGAVVHVLAGRLVDLTPLLGSLPTHSRDFH